MNTSNIPFKKQLQEDMKTALRAQEKERLGVIRLILAVLKKAEIDEGLETETLLANDPRILRILDKMRKQRQDSIQQYEQAQRADLAEQERFEESVICSYLPAPLSIEEVDQLIKQVIRCYLKSHRLSFHENVCPLIDGVCLLVGIEANKIVFRGFNAKAKCPNSTRFYSGAACPLRYCIVN
ncbi:GatB/YqeY domain-containing protein [Rickettsiella massiliensis]|uniref:GatB/YqeY domain-containing protein n=1 Tax=Rickettsiella massiliensis TaxID=676517 RepID=UPI00029A2C2B|nr:GatB/YqeY domain-containing protein [Rickettsiella massiliensis]